MSKQWHTLLRNAGPGQTTWRVPGPEESGVSCWANIASHHINIISILIRIKQDIFHIQTTDKITKNNTQWHSPLSVSRRGFLESRWSISLHEMCVTPNKVLILPTLCRSPGSLTQASHQNLSDRIEICSPQFLSINLDPEPNTKFVWTLLNCLSLGAAGDDVLSFQNWESILRSFRVFVPV